MRLLTPQRSAMSSVLAAANPRSPNSLMAACRIFVRVTSAFRVWRALTVLALADLRVFMSASCLQEQAEATTARVDSTCPAQLTVELIKALRVGWQAGFAGKSRRKRSKENRMETGYPPIRRVVTGHDAAHVAKVLRDEPATNAKHPQPGLVSTMLWCTDGTPAA